MKKIVYLPLDERPCNNTFCQFLAQNNNEINLVCPPLSILGLKKKPADYQKIAAFLTEQCADADRLACLAVTHCGRRFSLPTASPATISAARQTATQIIRAKLKSPDNRSV